MLVAFTQGTTNRAYNPDGSVYAWEVDGQELPHSTIKMPRCSTSDDDQGAYRLKPWTTVGGESTECPL